MRPRSWSCSTTWRRSTAPRARGATKLTKVSYGAIPYLLDKYRILRAGGALGHGCGPLVIARNAAPGFDALSKAPGTRYAMPGRFTTAYLLLRLALGFEPKSVEMRFDAVVDAVKSGAVDAGVIIHESRFTLRARRVGRVARPWSVVGA